MGQDTLKAAVLGLNSSGLEFIQTAVETGYYEIVAVAGRDPELTEKTARKYECAAFDDYRQLIIQNEFDVLLTAAPVHGCDEYIRLAMKKGSHVLKLLPPALNFEQTAEYLKTAKKNKVCFQSIKSYLFEPAFEAISNALSHESDDSILLLDAVCHFAAPLDKFEERWLSDPQLAGGGVLLRNCFETIDQIVTLFGLPQQVYSLNTNNAPDRQQRLSVTEDLAVITMKYSDTFIANVTASRIFGPAQQLLKIFSREKYLLLQPGLFSIHDYEGNKLEDSSFPQREKLISAEAIRFFARSLLEPDQVKPLTHRSSDLHTMAVIEAAYLSARTGMPEDPMRIMKIASAEETPIWTSVNKGII